jgi:hypothetical protein
MVLENKPLNLKNCLIFCQFLDKILDFSPSTINQIIISINSCQKILKIGKKKKKKKNYKKKA